MLTRWLSIIRWNNFPRVVDWKQMDNVGATLHTALFLVHLEENVNIDTLYLIKKIIFTSFADLILSDINSGTKSYIKKLDAKIFEELYSKAYEYFLELPGEEILIRDMKDTLTRKDRPREDALILAAKKYVGYFEASTNARVFPDIYEVPLAAMKAELKAFEAQLPSFSSLRNTPNFEKYLAHIYRLSSSMRWNQYNRTTPISVMSHKVVVAYISYIIGMIGNAKGENNDILQMLLRAIYHDVPEVITGDIITPTKKAVLGFVELLEKVESAMMDDYLFGYISPEYTAFLSPYILHPFEWDIGKKVKYADILSALIEAKVEQAQGNAFFAEKYQVILEHVTHFEHPGVEYILKEIFFSFDTKSDDSIRPSY